MSIFDAIFNKNKAIAEMMDCDFIVDTSQRAYLKRLAIDTVLNYVARTMSTVKFRFKQNGKVIPNDWDYILNTKPNKDSSAVDFWQKFFYKLMIDNEVLVITTDDDQLLIADDFHRNEYAVYEDTFDGVTVKDYIFNRQFKMSEVIYLEYNNEELEKFALGLFNDYGELFGRIIEVSMRNNQIRASVSVDATGSINGVPASERLKNYVNSLYKSFKTSSVAIVPKTKGFEYEEYTNTTGTSKQALSELDDMKKSLVSDVARWVGVPSALIFGENADLDSNVEAYKRMCIDNLVMKLQAELINKLITKRDYQQGKTIQIYNILPNDPVKSSTQIDKLISSGFATQNEMRELFGWQRVEDSSLDEFHITKNYEKLKGGDTDEETEN